MVSENRVSAKSVSVDRNEILVLFKSSEVSLCDPYFTNLWAQGKDLHCAGLPAQPIQSMSI